MEATCQHPVPLDDAPCSECGHDLHHDYEDGCGADGCYCPEYVAVCGAPIPCAYAYGSTTKERGGFGGQQITGCERLADHPVHDLALPGHRHAFTPYECANGHPVAVPAEEPAP